MNARSVDLPTSGVMLDDLSQLFDQATLQSMISDKSVATPSKWRMEIVAELWQEHCHSLMPQ